MSLSVSHVSAALDHATYVIARLEEAGSTLLALPMSGHSTGMRCGMPDVVHTAIEAYGWAVPAMRAPIPPAARISRMDEALAWIGHIPTERYVLRRIVGARALVHPLTERHLFSWPRVALAVGADRRAVQRWHAEAIGLIVARLHARGFIFPA